MPVQLTEDIIITEKKMDKILRDPEASATAIKLVYVSDSQEGIKRLKSGKGFRYLLGNKPVKQADLDRIKKLVIPPAWKDVWICTMENGHLQATGKDALQRKQYKYHHLWNKFRNQTKFYRMLQFGKALPLIRKQVEKDLQQKGLPREASFRSNARS